MTNNYEIGSRRKAMEIAYKPIDKQGKLNTY